MALDRWIALFILMICIAYGYAAWFTMDELLPPIMRRNPVWPSSFPKILSILGIALSLVVVLGLEKAEQTKAPEINYMRLLDYKIFHAIALLAFMVIYALTLRPAGFLLSTFLFLSVSSLMLGERRYLVVILVSAIAAGSIWYLVEQILGIYLRPFPSFV
ncbi:tripartite tricarboxylate transporter TctB family protein [Rhodobacteraceae bacterium RKSG542]|uniref:tripartite tricarboxylate transporter TctB family protein n=1 Tax=Pseudovibrio flavus TaxID=2529854 RepID=UPI0012BC593E|nr:tripartite tricarboxylate transporter TctB family protein [Pseudovibrio flavus]MTI17525.1 tripartite tricarboxylate transporter TctB family protein [Pseudovibrio flavus]